MKKFKNKIIHILTFLLIFNLTGCGSSQNLPEPEIIEDEQTTENNTTQNSLIELGTEESNNISENDVKNISTQSNENTLNNITVEPISNYYTDMNFSQQVLSETDEIALKDAISTVKKRIKIPEKFSEFSYQLNNQYNSSYFCLMWSTPDDKDNKEYIKVSIAGNIIVEIRDSTVSNYSDTPSFSKLSTEELLDKAKEYFKNINPQINSEVKFDIDSLDLYSSDAFITCKRYENGIYVKDNNGQIVLNKDTGELSSFYLTWWDTDDFKNIDNIKSQDEIKETFSKDLVTLSPYYKINYDYDTKEYLSSLIFVPSDIKEIDAYTGEWSQIWDDMYAENGHRYYGNEIYSSLSSLDTTESSIKNDFVTNNADFTEAELEKIETNDSLLKGEDIKKLLIDNEVLNFPSDCSLRSYNVYSYKNDDEIENFIAEVSFRTSDSEYDNISVKIDATTGEIFNYNRTINNDNSLPLIDVNKINKIGEKAKKILAPDFYNEYKASDENFKEPWFSEDNSYYETSRTLYYNRYINDIPVQNEAMSIEVDSLGNILYYSYNRTDIDFIDPSLMIKPEDAWKEFFKQKDFELYYDGWVSDNGELNIYLVYNIDSFLLDATTGEVLKNWFYFYNDDENIDSNINYVDIDDIPQRDKIKEFQKYNILLSKTNHFDANKIVTEEEFQNVLNSILNKYSIYSSPLNMDKEATNNKNLTNETAASIFTSYFDNENIAYIPGIFKSPFADVSDDDEYVGCFAIANAKHFLQGDKSNKIYPNKELTRGEVIEILYNYILSFQK